ncbi:tRNA pseudouridine(55) synthase TruB [Sporolactobacillus vineae]|uniref:tRNA pseudouridine(55) synthase TruB n=1 Tax=Sporolactobacillus vineae TaxID=444463 RepID=UPI000289F0AA|nr:tRNA pseudouridine(55) synthase TruB [Sporolactobacillus vineae]
MIDYNGLLPLYKPRGMTSHDCVARLRKLLKFKKIGHTGTLDPEVDGVLVLCLGRATKIAQYLLEFNKAYEGTIRLGTATTTEDEAGAVTESRELGEDFSRRDLEQVFQSFTGNVRQTVPIYSAVKVNGKKLYEYAREGLSVARPVREIHIYELKLTGNAEVYRSDIPFFVSCSKGTYVRTLAVDIGRKLGYPAHLKSLTRVQAGSFTLADCWSFDRIESLLDSGHFCDCLKPIECGLSHMDKWTVDDRTAEEVVHGAVLPQADAPDSPLFAVFDRNHCCLAIYERHPVKKGFIKPRKVLAVRA